MTGQIRVDWFGDEVSQRVRDAGAEGLLDGAEHLLGVANLTVPHDEGILEGTGTTDVDPYRLEASVSYDTPYAARLHEHPEYHFQGRGRGKWLELSAQEEGSRITEFLRDRLERELRS